MVSSSYKGTYSRTNKIGAILTLASFTTCFEEHHKCIHLLSLLRSDRGLDLLLNFKGNIPGDIKAYVNE